MTEWEYLKDFEKNEIRKRWFKKHEPKITVCDETKTITIRWAEPGTWNYGVFYTIHSTRGTLTVFGDLGEATYQWSGVVDIDFIGGCNIHYFQGKCQASSCGDRGKDWNDKIAADRIQDYVKDRIKELGGDSFYESLWLDGYLEEILKIKEPSFSKYFTEDGYENWKDLTKEEKQRFIVLAEEYLQKLKADGYIGVSKKDYRREYMEAKDKLADLLPGALGACSNEFEWGVWISDNGDEFFGDDWGGFGDIGKCTSIRVLSHLVGMKMIKEGLKSGKFIIDDPEPKPIKCPFLRLVSLFKSKPKPKARKIVVSREWETISA